MLTKAPRGAAAPKAATAQQHFRANIERFRRDVPPIVTDSSLEGIAAAYGFAPAGDWIVSGDDGVVERLCADLRMHRVWQLLADRSDRVFDEFLLNVLLALFCAGESASRRESCRFVLEAIAKVRKATQTSLVLLTETVAGLAIARISTRYVRLQSTILQPPIASLISFENRLKAYELKATKIVNEANRVLSRKAESSPHTEFVREMTPVMTNLFGRKHFAIVADLASVIFNVEIDADAAKKAFRNAEARKKTRRDDSTPKDNAEPSPDPVRHRGIPWVC